MSEAVVLAQRLRVLAAGTRTISDQQATLLCNEQAGCMIPDVILAACEHHLGIPSAKDSCARRCQCSALDLIKS